MREPLAKVTFDLDGPRGADVEHSVRVPEAFAGATVAITLPKKLACAHCHGGGCDRCARSGAISLELEEGASNEIAITLPSPFPEADPTIRVPGLGGRSDETSARGHLLLRVVVDRSGRASADPGDVRRLPGDTDASRHEERKKLARSSLVVAVLLVATFFGLLRLSGWL